MAQRRFHYEQAFEHYLRTNRYPYIAVDEARKSLIPPDHKTRTDGTLKNFDFVVYGPNHNQLIDVKGRKCRLPPPSPIQKTPNQASFNFSSAATPRAQKIGRLESWVTQDDLDSLTEWERLFGSDFRAYFIFLYWCEAQPPDALFQEIFELRNRWYALRAIALTDYVTHMRPRSKKWRTFSIPTADFRRISIPVAQLQQSTQKRPSKTPADCLF